jgi:hypothetical protein
MDSAFYYLKSTELFKEEAAAVTSHNSVGMAHIHQTYGDY